MQHFVRRSTSLPFRRFLGDVRREFMQRLSAALHGTLGSYLRDAFQEGSSNVVACFRVPRSLVFPSFVLLAWWLACFPLLPPLSLSFPSAINFSPHYISWLNFVIKPCFDASLKGNSSILCSFDMLNPKCKLRQCIHHTYNVYTV